MLLNQQGPIPSMDVYTSNIPWNIPWKKIMTNLERILKSRDITLPTKVHQVKAMFFPVVMYGSESWTLRKAEHEELMLLNCSVGEES